MDRYEPIPKGKIWKVKKSVIRALKRRSKRLSRELKDNPQSLQARQELQRVNLTLEAYR